MAGAGYDISLSGSDAKSSGVTSPFSATDTSIGSGAGRLTTGLTGTEVAFIAGLIALGALAAVWVWRRF